MQHKARLIGAAMLAASLLVALMLGAFWQSAPVFASDALEIAQADPAHGCDDDASVTDRGPGDGCDDPCDDAAVADRGPGDGCDDPCDDAAAADRGPGDDDCDNPCNFAGSASADRGDPGSEPGDDDCDTEDAYARIVSMPVTGTVGLWVIGANTYSVTEQTRLEQDYGAFAVDKCVEVTWAVAEPGAALKIETKRDYKCDDDDDDDDSESEFYGFVTALPDDPALLGVWTVRSITFTVGVSTELDTRHGEFALGSLVKVHFDEVDGVKVAREVRTIWTPKEGDDDWAQWRRANAFGAIESMPVSGTVGTWVIAGVPYTVVELTRLHENNGPFAVGAFVKVQYVLSPSGDRYAAKIQTTHDRGGTAPGEYRFIGVVDIKPVAFVGEWTISGATFVATDTTVFNEAKGLLVEGASVAVRYVITNDMRLASEIRTIVPPGGGDHHHVGRIERSGTSSVAEASVASVDGKATNIWTVGGQDFVVNPGTLLDDELAALDVGGVAYVNSYVETDGSLVATSIEGLPANLQQYLPMLQR